MIDTNNVSSVTQTIKHIIVLVLFSQNVTSNDEKYLLKIADTTMEGIRWRCAFPSAMNSERSLLSSRQWQPKINYSDQETSILNNPNNVQKS